ncbi:hypothetical protein F4781DRAFT_441043 [Annulohypoxylon bovei var. microspora]|nr:hypothetical protein F4781DRAFT_441043 [Annulohypoxylon bovei var. microspora]
MLLLLPGLNSVLPPPKMSNLDISLVVSKETDPGCHVLQLVLSRHVRCYQKLFEVYYQASHVCIVPKVFADMLLHSVLSIRDENCFCDLETGALSMLAKGISAETSLEASYRTESVDISSYFFLFTGEKLRWEGLGIFCALVASSAMLLSPTSKHLANSKERDGLISDMVEASSLCVELWRKSGSINDIAVMSIYQNFIVISQHYGDKDYRTWRQLVELIGVVFEAGLHNDKGDTRIPEYFLAMRRYLFAAAYSIDITLCTIFKRPPMISHRFCTICPPLGLSIEAFSHISHIERESWIRLRFVISTFREKLLMETRDINEHRSINEVEGIIPEYSSKLDNLPDYIRCCNDALDGHADEHIYRIRLLLASIHLEYLSIKLQANHQLRRYNSMIRPAREMMTTVLGLDLPRRGGASLPRGYASMVVLYGVPAASILIYELKNALSSNSTDHGNNDLSRGETIKSLAYFIARLDCVIRGKYEDSEELWHVLDELMINFDAAIEKLGTLGDDSCVSSRKPFQENEHEGLAWAGSVFDLISSFVDLKDDIWRL